MAKDPLMTEQNDLLKGQNALLDRQASLLAEQNELLEKLADVMVRQNQILDQLIVANSHPAVARDVQRRVAANSRQG